MKKEEIRKQDTPNMLINKYDQSEYKKISKDMKEAKEILEGRGHGWPDFCVFPCGWLREILLDLASDYDVDVDDPVLLKEAHELASEMIACWLWRRHKTIYRFDDDSVDLLCDQAEAFTGDEIISFEALSNSPQGVYIKAPGIMPGMDGFFFWIDAEMPEYAPVLMIQWLHDDKVTTHNLMCPLVPGGSIKDGAQCYIDKIREYYEEDVGRRWIEVLMSNVFIALPFIRYVAAESSKEEKVNGIAGEITVHDVCTDDLKKR